MSLEPKFKPGDRVVLDNGTMRTIVSAGVCYETVHGTVLETIIAGPAPVDIFKIGDIVASNKTSSKYVVVSNIDGEHEYTVYNLNYDAVQYMSAKELFKTSV